MSYVHGYDPRENLRLQDQASTLGGLLHSDLYRTAQEDGVFCYTFFKAVAVHS